MATQIKFIETKKEILAGNGFNINKEVSPNTKFYIVDIQTSRKKPSYTIGLLEYNQQEKTGMFYKKQGGINIQTALYGHKTHETTVVPVRGGYQTVLFYKE